MLFDGIDRQVHGCGTVVNGSSQPDRLLTQGINKLVSAAGGGKSARDWANAVADGGMLALGLSSAARAALARQLEARVAGAGPKSGRQLTDDELSKWSARKSDTRQIDAVCNEFNVNRTQREMLHREITGQGLSLDEIRLIAKDIALNKPTKGAQCFPRSAEDRIGAPRKGQDPMTGGDAVDGCLNDATVAGAMKSKLLELLIGQPCWHISVGAPTRPSFELVAGPRVARPVPLTNPSQPDEFRRYRGSIHLLVWSAWRLQTETEVIVTSDAGDEIVAGLRAVVGSSILGVRCEAPAWDLRLEFANGLRIVTFSDRIGADAKAQNWEVWAFGRYIGAGPGQQWHEAAEDLL